MKALVIYDSQFGNTEKIAQQIASTLREFGEARAVRVTDAHVYALTEMDLVVIGGPTQAWQATGVVKDLIAHLGHDGLDRVFAGAFDTRFDKPRWLTGSAAVGIEKQLKRIGMTLLLPPESFFVEDKEGPLKEGELERAAQWARSLHDVYVRQEKLLAVTS